MIKQNKEETKCKNCKKWESDFNGVCNQHKEEMESIKKKHKKEIKELYEVIDGANEYIGNIRLKCKIEDLQGKPNDKRK